MRKKKIKDEENIQKRFIEACRESLLKKAVVAIKEYQKGKAKSGSLKDLYNDVEND